MAIRTAWGGLSLTPSGAATTTEATTVGTFVGAAANGGNVTALTTANATGITWPAVQAGDLAILVWSWGDSTVTATNPTGTTFTQTGNVQDGNVFSRLLTRVCDGSETGTIAGWSTSLQNRQSAVLYVVRGYASVAGAVSRQETVTGTSHDCPSIGTGNGAADGDTVIVIASDRAGSTTAAAPPAGYSTRTNTEFAATGTGGTYTGVADDGLAGGTVMPVDPASWTGFVSSGTAVTWTVALRPASSDTPISGADSSTLSEGAAAVERQGGVSDAGSVGDLAALERQSSQVDSGGFSEATELAAQAAAAESTAFSEATAVAVDGAVSDTGVLSEASTIFSTFASTDVAALGEIANVGDLTEFTAADSGGLAESSTVQQVTSQTSTDAVVLDEIAALERIYALSDTATATEAATTAATAEAVEAFTVLELAAVGAFTSLAASDSGTVAEASSIEQISSVTERPFTGTTTRTSGSPLTTTRPDLGTTERL